MAQSTELRKEIVERTLKPLGVYEKRDKSTEVGKIAEDNEKTALQKVASFLSHGSLVPSRRRRRRRRRLRRFPQLQ